MIIGHNIIIALAGVANNDHEAQTIDSVSYKAVLDASNARVILGADYDEIKDEPYTEKSPLHHFEDESMEFTKSNNEYFTLMPQEAQAEAITNVNILYLSIIINIPST